MDRFDRAAELPVDIVGATTIPAVIVGHVTMRVVGRPGVEASVVPWDDALRARETTATSVGS